MAKYKTALGLNGFGWAYVVYNQPYDFEKILVHAAKLGFDGVELFGMPENYPVEKSAQFALRKQIEDHGLVVASIQSLPGGLGNGHPASAYSLCRKDYVNYIQNMLDLAVTLGCEAMGVWAGELFGTGPNEQSINYMAEVYTQCAALAKDAGIPLVLEAEPVQQVNTPEVWFRILKATNSKYLRALCDLAHINILSKQKPLELLKELQPYIGYTHLAGNDGTCTKIESRSSTHLALTEGSMDWKAMLNQILDGGYDGWLDIDVWENPDPFGASEAGKKALDEFLAKR
ncbi:sugar phosphate isomerase/epimerase [Candidatus Vecturithrix granuli]|uniref:Sugar phosphate isomerase/epimerase n=1 Tax=Vecturithrix granuli TaxID=1499967 RepID=A0A081BY43_VECG1|nr:sugar phosphate isomerase/epimerase [Candidatus Vecturithrix granuli]